MPVAALVALSLGLTVLSPAQASDWPRFRGPSLDGRSTETGLLERWPDDGIDAIWRVKGGEGFSGLSVVGGTLVTAAKRGDDTFVVAFDVEDGSERWATRIGSGYENRFGDGPRATPAVHDGRVYALSAEGSLVTLSLGDGSIVWKRDLREAYGSKIPTWGLSASPLLHDGKLLVQVGGKDALFVAFDPRDGSEIWRSGNGLAGYATPLPVEVEGREQVVFFSGKAIHGIDPDDGRELWSVPWDVSYDVNAAMPALVGTDRVLLSSGYDKGSVLIRLEASEGGASVREVWRSRELKNQFSSSIVIGDHAYGFDDKTFKCMRLSDGATVWRQRRLGHGSLTEADGRLFVLGDRGTLVMVEATPEAYRELGRFEPFDGKTWTVPTIAGGVLYVRDESEIAAYPVGRAEPRSDEGETAPKERP